MSVTPQRTEVLREFPFPVFEGERHSRPSLILNRLAQRYRTRFVNVLLMRVGHAPDGICARRKQVQCANPRGYRQYVLEWVRDYHAHAHFRQLLSYYRRYVKYSLLSAVPLRMQWREVRSPLCWLLMLIPAWLDLRGQRTMLPAAR